MFESEEAVCLGLGTGLFSILSIAVTILVVVVVSVVVVVVVVVEEEAEEEAACSKNAKQTV